MKINNRSTKMKAEKVNFKSPQRKEEEINHKDHKFATTIFAIYNCLLTGLTDLPFSIKFSRWGSQ